MYRKLVGALVVMVVAIGFVAAEDLNGVITKVDGDKITFQKMTKAKKGVKSEKEGDPIVLTVNKDAKIVAKKFDKDAKKVVEEEVKDGLKAELFAKIDPEKGLNAVVTADDGKVSKIAVGGGKKKAAQ